MRHARFFHGFVARCVVVGVGGGEWVRGLGLGFTNPEGTGGMWDVCLCVGLQWCGWCYVCLCWESIICRDGRYRYLCIAFGGYLRMKGCRPLKFYGVGGNVWNHFIATWEKNTSSTLQYPPSFKRQNLSIFIMKYDWKLNGQFFVYEGLVYEWLVYQVLVYEGPVSSIKFVTFQ